MRSHPWIDQGTTGRHGVDPPRGSAVYAVPGPGYGSPSSRIRTTSAREEIPSFVKTFAAGTRWFGGTGTAPPRRPDARPRATIRAIRSSCGVSCQIAAGHAAARLLRSHGPRSAHAPPTGRRGRSRTSRRQHAGASGRRRAGGLGGGTPRTGAASARGRTPSSWPDAGGAPPRNGAAPRSLSEQGVATFHERERPGRAGVTRPPLQVIEARLRHLPPLGVERRFDRVSVRNR